MALQHVYLFICLFVFRYYENKLYSIDFLYLNGRWLFVKLFDGLNLKESKCRIDIREHGTAQMEITRHAVWGGFPLTQMLRQNTTVQRARAESIKMMKQWARQHAKFVVPVHLLMGTTQPRAKIVQRERT